MINDITDFKKIRFPAHPTIPQRLDPLAGCLCDAHGNPLRSDPAGALLCFQALPHYKATVQERRDKFANKKLITDSRHQLLEEKNQPIPIANEHELAHLYLGENLSLIHI